MRTNKVHPDLDELEANVQFVSVMLEKIIFIAAYQLIDWLLIISADMFGTQTADLHKFSSSLTLIIFNINQSSISL